MYWRCQEKIDVGNFWDLKGLSPPPKPFDCLLLAIWVSMRSARQQGWDSCLQASFSNRFRLFSRFRFFSRLFFCIEFSLIWKSPFLPLKSILGRQSCHVWLGSLSSDVVERRTSTGNGLFSHFSRDFEQTFGQIVSIRIKTLGNINTVA